MALTTAVKTELYRFFAVAFNAAPGVTYMNQLYDAYEGFSKVFGDKDAVLKIVEVFTAKEQFTSIYPAFFTNQQFAEKLVANVVGTSASEAAKAEAVSDIVAALGSGLSRGKVVYNVFNNLAARAGDAQWGGTANLLANKVAYAEYFTETILGTTTDLSTLQAVIGQVTSTSSTDAASIATSVDNVLNPKPIFSSAAAASAAENGTGTITVAAKAADGTAVTYAISGGADAALFNISGGVLSFNAAPDFEAAADAGKDNVYNVSVKATDSKGNATTQDIAVTVTDVNEAPSKVAASNAEATVAENSAATAAVKVADLVVTDDKLGTNTLSLSGADKDAFEIKDGSLFIKSGTALNFEGAQASYTVSVTATDASVTGSATTAVTVKLSDVNEAPTAAATQTVKGTEDTAATVTVAGADVDAKDVLTYTAGTAKNGVVTGGTGGVFTYTPAQDFNGSDSFEVTVKDAAGLSTTQTVTVEVAPVNDAPVFAAASVALSGSEDKAASITVLATDVDKDTLTYSAGAAKNGTVSGGAAGAFTYTPNLNYFGTDSFVVTASDGNGGTTTQTVNVTLAEVSTAPTASDVSRAVADNTTLNINVLSSASDIDTGDSLSVQSIGAAKNGTATLKTDGTVDYTPNATFLNGTDSFSYTVVDSRGKTATATVNMTVNTVNNAPVITAGQTFSVTENENTAGLSVGFAKATDEEGGTPQNWAISAGDTDGMFAINPFTGEITRTSKANFDAEKVTSYTLTLTATDGSGLASAPQTVTVNVANVNDNAPVISASSVTIDEGTTAAGTVTSTDADSGATATYSVAAGGDGASFAIDAKTGALSFKAAPDFEAPADGNKDNVYDVTVAVTDGGSTTSKAIAVTVKDLNDTAPVITSAAAFGYAENATAAVFPVTSTDADTTKEAASYSITGGKDAALFSIDSKTGAVSFVSSPNFEAPTDDGKDNVYNITVGASDGTNASKTQDVAITVSNVNENPTAVADSASALTGQTVNIAVLANDTDVDGPTAGAAVGTVTAVTQPAQGGLVTIASDGKSINFASTPGYASPAGSPVTFNYTVTDAGGLTSSATVSVTVNTQLGGTSGNDLLLGSTAAETMEGGAGNDTIDGGAGNDVIDAGADDDRVIFRGTESNITGNTGTDLLVVSAINNKLTAVDLSSGANQATGVNTTVTSFENVDASAVSQNLAITGSTLSTALTAGSGSDNVTTSSTATVTITLNAGNDTFSGSTGIEIVDGGDGDDRITGGGGNDIVTAGAGNDSVTTVAGADSVSGGDGNDTLTVGDGANTVSGGAGNDNITAGTGNDSIAADAGNDTIDTGNGINTVTGGDGNDSITAGTGTDNLSGGAGNDTFVLAGNLTSADTISGGDGTADTLSANAGAVDTTFTNVTGVEVLSLATSGSVTLAATAQAAGIVSITGNAGIDTISASAYTVGLAVTAGAGNDRFTTSSGGDSFTYTGTNLDANDTVTAGTGTDTIRLDNSAAAVSATIDFTNITGVEQISVVDVDGASSTTAEAITLQLGNNEVTSTQTITIDAGVITDTNDTVTVTMGTSSATSYSVTGGAGADNLPGSSLADTINGGGGADTIDGAAGNDVLSGGDGNDSITAGTGNDNLSGGAGNDTFVLVGNLTSADTISGGDGTADTLSANAGAVDTTFTNVTGVEVLSLASAGSYTLGATAQAAGIVSITGNGGNDTISASAYTVGLAVTAGAGDDSFTTGSGGDSFTYTGTNLDANDTVTAGTGTDTIRLDNSAAAVSATIDFDNFTGIESVVVVDVDGANSTSAEAIALTLAAVTATTVQTISISGSVITDTNDTIAITNNAATTTTKFSITGGAGIDTLAGSNAADTISGGGGTDSLTGNDGDDQINGEAGNDTLDAGAGSDTVTGGDGNDSITAGAGNDNLSGGAGTDTFVFAANFTRDDTVAGGDGNDTLSANAGGADIDFNNVTSVEVLSLASAATTTLGAIAQAAGIVSITGNGGNDTISASAYTVGLAVTAGAGDDSFTTGSGGDSFTYTGSNLDAADTVAAGTGTDTIRLDNSAAAVSATIDFDNFTGIESVVVVDVDGANSTSAEAIALTLAAITATTSQTITIDGSAITDTNDTIAITNSANTTTTKFSITGGAGIDTLAGNNAADTISGGGGTDSLTGNDGNDSLVGGAGADTLIGGAGNDVIAGDDGADEINGGAGADTITGGAGDDTITTGAGLDVITGGAGADRFVITVPTSGLEYASIQDFSIAAGARDTLVFSNTAGDDTFNSAKIVLAGAASLQDYLDNAANSTTADGAIRWFQYNGNTYVVQNVSIATTFQSGVDFVVELVGLIDLSTSVGSGTGNLTGGPNP